MIHRDDPKSERPTPFPEPRPSQQWRDRDGHVWTVERVWRRPASHAPDTVEVYRLLEEDGSTWRETRSVDGAEMLTSWRRVDG